MAITKKTEMQSIKLNVRADLADSLRKLRAAVDEAGCEFDLNDELEAVLNAAWKQLRKTATSTAEASE